MDGADTSRATLRPGVARLAAAAVLALLGVQFALPAAVAELAARGHAAATAGSLAMLQPLAMLAVFPALPALRRRLGPGAALRAAFAAGALGALLFVLDGGGAPWWWWPAAALFGATLGIAWPTVDAALAEGVPPARAGALIGLYQTLLAAAVAAGPAAVALGGLSMRGAAACALACLAGSILLAARAWPANREGRTGSEAAAVSPPPSRAFWRRHPWLPVLGFVAGLFELGTPAMATVHALYLGLGAAAALLVASVIAAGSLAAQVPLGALSDRAGPVAVLRASCAALLASALLLPATSAAPPLLWALAVVWGALGGGLQTLAYARAAQAFRGEDVAEATRVVAASFTLGMLAGPAVGGPLSDASPTLGLAVLLAAGAVAGLLALRRAPDGKSTA